MRETGGPYSVQRRVSLDELEQWLLEAIKNGKDAVWDISETAAQAIGWPRVGKVSWLELYEWLKLQVKV